MLWQNLVGYSGIKLNFLFLENSPISSKFYGAEKKTHEHNALKEMAES
jgi:hypothetical protein